MSESAILPPKQQPKIVHKLVVRSIIAVILVMILAVAVVLIQKVQDLDLPTKANTSGMISALQYESGGAHAVLIKADGTVTSSRGWHAEANDREPYWTPDGNRVYFASDRDNKQVHLFRWNPGNGKVERRTQTRGSYSGLSYVDGDTSRSSALVVANGAVLQFDPVVGTTRPVIPPPVKATEESLEGGSVGGMEQIYGDIGNSFKAAAWFGSKKEEIIGILKGDRGETLIVQDPKPIDGRLKPPALIAAGDRIDMDVCRSNGKVVFTVLNYRFPDPNNVPPEFIKNGRVVVPVRHMAGLLDPSVPGALVTMIGSQDNRTCFANPVISPDGTSALLLAGSYTGDGDIDGKVLISVPVREGAASSVTPVHRGPVFSPSFSPDGKLIVFELRGAGGAKSIHVMNSDGSNDRSLTEGKGNFGSPRFSPQAAP